MKKLTLLAASVLVIVSTCVATAHAQKPIPEPSVSPKIDVTRLLLQITENPSFPPGYSEINSPGETLKWVWVTRFVKIPGRQVHGKPIRAIRFEPVFNGETVDVKVTVLRGESKGFEQEDLVGVYQVGIDEQRTINELDRFGIEPITISIANTVSPLPPPPAFENLTKAVEIVSVQAENIPRPAYKIALRNVSDKSILAVKVESFNEGRRALSALLQGEDNRVYLAPGGVSERRLHASKTEKTSAGYAPGTPSSVTISIRTVVFDDLSFEGEQETACTIEGFVMGRRFWLKQVLALLDQELSKPNTDNVEAAKQFKEKLSALSFDLEESELNKPSAVARECRKPAQGATVIMNGMKVDLVRELERIVSSQPAQPINFKQWMEERRTRYSAWLARL